MDNELVLRFAIKCTCGQDLDMASYDPATKGCITIYPCPVCCPAEEMTPNCYGTGVMEDDWGKLEKKCMNCNVSEDCELAKTNADLKEMNARKKK